MAFNKLASLTQKTLKQKRNQKIEGNKVVEFVDKATNGLSYEVLPYGAYVEFQDITGIKAAYFNQYAFIQSDSNLNPAGTGIQANNRQEVDATWLQTFNFELPNPAVDSNVDYFVENYKNGEYADIMVDGKFEAEFVEGAFAQLEESSKLLYANRLLFGTDKKNKAGATLHYKGLKDLISIAKSAAAITSIDNIQLIGGEDKATNIDLSDESITDLDAFSQINNLLYKLSQINDCFTCGLDATDTTRWINKGTSSIRGVCWNSFIEKVKAKNYQFFKELSNLIELGILLPLVESTLNVEQAARAGAEKGQATPISITPASLGLASDEIAFYDADSFLGYKYDVADAGRTITANNLTTSLTKVNLSQVADYLPTGVIAVVKAPSVVSLSDNIQP